jgi:hypothetical protein
MPVRSMAVTLLPMWQLKLVLTLQPGFIASGTSYVYINKGSAGYDVNEDELFQVSPGSQYDLLNYLGASIFIA